MRGLVMRGLICLTLLALVFGGIGWQQAFASKMYWAETSLRKIQRANLDGSNVEDVLIGLSSSTLGTMAFNSLRSPNAYPYNVPQILVTLLSFSRRLIHRYWTAIQ
jgi:Low-density lipoprotein receptor repeat class B